MQFKKKNKEKKVKIQKKNSKKYGKIIYTFKKTIIYLEIIINFYQ